MDDLSLAHCTKEDEDEDEKLVTHVCYLPRF